MIALDHSLLLRRRSHFIVCCVVDIAVYRDTILQLRSFGSRASPLVPQGVSIGLSITTARFLGVRMNCCTCRCSICNSSRAKSPPWDDPTGRKETADNCYDCRCLASPRGSHANVQASRRFGGVHRRPNRRGHSQQLLLVQARLECKAMWLLQRGRSEKIRCPEA